MVLFKAGFGDFAALRSMPPELAGAQRALKKLRHEDAWKCPEVNFRLHDATKNFIKSQNALSSQNFEDVFLTRRYSGKEYGDKAFQILQRWENSSEPVLASIVARAGDYFGFTERQREIAGMASVLGAYDTRHAYHNASHNRKVVVQAARIALEAPQLSSEYLCKLITAACIHDLGHNGKGNVVDGKHTPFMLEKLATSLARPYLEAAGADEKFMNDICAIVCATDVSPLGAPDTPARLVATSGKLPEELKSLEFDPMLKKCGQLLQVADVASSAGLCLGQSVHETCAVRREMGMEPDVGKAVPSFKFFISACDPIFKSSPEAVALYKDNAANITVEMDRLAAQTPDQAQKFQIK